MAPSGIEAGRPTEAPVEPPCAPELLLEFRLGQSAPDPEAESEIVEFAGWLRDHADHRVEIDGHTDWSGPEGSNLALSYARAERLATHLVRLGVDEDRLAIRGYGPYQPLADTPKDAAAQRRVRAHVPALEPCTTPATDLETR